MTEKYYDEELEEEIERKEFCKYGLCMLCGSPNFTPKRMGNVWVCKECRKSRFEDSYSLSKEYRDFN